ncbi:MAG: hypothetical protein Kilf2KO_37870 [Rhodospirillales bacterium]
MRSVGARIGLVVLIVASLLAVAIAFLPRDEAGVEQRQASLGSLVWATLQVDQEAARLQEAVNRSLLVFAASAKFDESLRQSLRSALDDLGGRLTVLQRGVAAAGFSMEPQSRRILAQMEQSLPYYRRVFREATISEATLANLKSQLPEVRRAAQSLGVALVEAEKAAKLATPAQALWSDRHLHFALAAGAVLVTALLAALALVSSSARRRVRALERSYEDLRHGLEDAPSAFAYFDAEDRAVFFNRSFAGYCEQAGTTIRKGRRFQEILQACLAVGLYRDAQGREQQWLAARLAAHRGPFSRNELHLNDGRWLLIEEVRSQAGGSLIVATDVTAIKRAQTEVETSSRAKEALLAMAFHGSRAPMDALVGSLTLLHGEDLSPNARSLLEAASGASADLARSLERQSSLMNAGVGDSQVPRSLDFHLKKLLHGPFAYLREEAAGRDIDLKLTVDPALPRSLHGDSERLRQVLLILLDSVIAGAGRGDLQVDFRRGPATAEGAILLRCELRAGTLSLRSAVATKGLRIVAGLLEDLGGALILPSGGASGRLSFEVPLEPARERDDLTAIPDQAAYDGDAFDRPVGAKPRILVVESQPSNQMLLQAYLERIGATAETVDGCRAARERAAEVAFDMILIEVKLPLTDGMSTAQAIRQGEGPCKNVPILALIANPMPQDLERCRERGMDGCIARPIDPARLAQVLRRWLPSKLPSPPEIATGLVAGLGSGDRPRFDDPLCRTALDDLVQSTGKAVASELVSDFLDDLGERLAALYVAAEAMEREALTKQAQDIRKAALLFGAVRPQGLAQQIEAEAEHLSRGEAVRLVSEMEAAIATARKAYAGWQAGLGTALDQIDESEEDTEDSEEDKGDG